MSHPVRDLVLSWWAEHPDASSAAVADHFNTGPGRATLPDGTPAINKGTARNWKRRYGAEYGLEPGQKKRAAPLPDRPAAPRYPLEPGCKLYDLITVPDPAGGFSTVRRDRYIVQQIRKARPVSVAAQVAGLPKQRVYEWLKRGREQEAEGVAGAYRDFAERVEEARAAAESMLVGLVLEGATTDWRAALKLLERRYPERWMERKMVETTHTVASAGEASLEVALVIASMSPEQLRAGAGVDLDELGKPDKPEEPADG